MGWLRNLEKLPPVLGFILLAIYVGARIHNEVLSRAAIGSFKGEHATLPEQAESPPGMAHAI